MDVYSQIAEKIIERQETIIGPVAIEQAKQVPGISVDWPAHQVLISGDKAHAIDELVNVYEGFFGRISVEVSKDAAHSFLQQLPLENLPRSLR